jgi:hypothetical protein
MRALRLGQARERSGGDALKPLDQARERSGGGALKHWRRRASAQEETRLNTGLGALALRRRRAKKER